MKIGLILLLLGGTGLGLIVAYLARSLSTRQFTRGMARPGLDRPRTAVAQHSFGVGPKIILEGAPLMLPKPWQTAFGSPDHITAWHLRTLSSCEDRVEARIRLIAALNILGAEADPKPEGGLSERQQTLEQLIRSVVIFLAR